MKHFFMMALCVFAALLAVSCVSTTSGANVKEQSWSFSALEADSVEVRLYSSTVEVRLWENQEIYVYAESSDGRLPSCRMSGSTLLCKAEMGGEGHNCKVVIFVPESFFAEEWKITTESGRVDVSQLWGENCEIQTTSGRIKMTKCEVQELEVGSVSGRIDASDIICSGSSDISTTSGRVEISGFMGQADVSTVSGAIDIDQVYPFIDDCCISSLSGSIHLKMPENNGFVLEYDTLSGAVRNEFTSFHGKGSGKDVYKNKSVKIEVETLSGSVTISRR